MSNSENMAKELREKILSIDPSANGIVHVKSGEAVGDLTSSIITSEDMETIASELGLKNSVTVGGSNLFTSSENGEKDTYFHDEVNKRWKHRAEVKVLYQGHAPLDLIETTSEYKVLHPKNMDKARGPIQEFKFISPVIVDKNFKVIDGNLRVEIALKEKFKDIPIVILDLNTEDADDKRVADGLRLFLNRSSEFQRWNYDEVDKYIDDNVALQPIAEPLGFFSNNILPVSYFSQSIIKYEIDPYNDQQKQYKQEEGIAEWAKIMRERKEEERRRREERRKPKKDSDEYTPLLELKPSEGDFMEVHDLHEEMDKTTNETKEMAETITNNYDAIMRKKKEEKGIPWQRSKRKGHEVVEAKRRSSIDKAISNLEKEMKKKDISDDLKRRIEESLEDRYSQEESIFKNFAEEVKNS